MRENLPYIFSVPEIWYKGLRKDEGEVCKASRPFSILNPASDKAVLLVHGYTGYPGELVRPAEDLYLSGFDVYVPRLPGHGTNAEDFVKSSYTEWLKMVENAVRDLEKRYKSLYLVGHSMGGTIVSIILSRFNTIKSAVAASPAYVINGLDEKAVLALKLLSIGKKKIRKKWKSDHGYRLHYENAPADDERLGAEYWSYIFPSQLIGLYKLAKEASEGVKKIKTPFLIIEAGSDSIVSNEGTENVTSSNKYIEHSVVDGATHFIYYDKVEGTEDKAVSLTLSFLSD